MYLGFGRVLCFRIVKFARKVRVYYFIIMFLYYRHLADEA
jgi:hypothetical protein